MTKYVYDFSEGNRDMKDLLGGKGANLAEMTNMGLPVPPGFMITTEACLAYLKQDAFPEGLMPQTEEHLTGLESAMDKRLGDPSDAWRTTVGIVRAFGAGVLTELALGAVMLAAWVVWAVTGG